MDEKRIQQIIINALENHREGVNHIGYIRVDRRNFERVAKEATKKIIAENCVP